MAKTEEVSSYDQSEEGVEDGAKMEIDWAAEGRYFFFMFMSFFSSWSVWVLLSPLLVIIIQNLFGRSPQSGAKRFLKTLPLIVFVIITHRLLGTTLIDLVNIGQGKPWSPLFTMRRLPVLLSGLIPSMFMMVMAGAFLFGFQYYSWFLRKEKELANAKLQALVMQLQPHFLFNTLNSIASLVDIDTKRAQRMLAQLGYLLRKMLDQSEPTHGLVPLEEELTFIRNYLDIEQVRFMDRLKIHYQIAEGTEQALVPYLIIQPLVENAIKHGVAPLTDNGELNVRTRRVSDGVAEFLELEVSDNGPGLPETSKGRRGVGLRNIRERLAQRYGSNANLTLGPCLSGTGLSAVIRLPLDFANNETAQ